MISGKIFIPATRFGRAARASSRSDSIVSRHGVGFRVSLEFLLEVLACIWTALRSMLSSEDDISGNETATQYATSREENPEAIKVASLCFLHLQQQFLKKYLTLEEFQLFTAKLIKWQITQFHVLSSLT